MKNDLVRIRVGFSHEAAKWLDESAEAHGISPAEVIRRIVDEVRGISFVERRSEQPLERITP
jgi:hypothetical protein